MRWFKRNALVRFAVILAFATFGGWCLLSSSRAESPGERRFALNAEVDKFWSLLPRDAELTKVGGGFGFTDFDAPNHPARFYRTLDSQP